MHSISLIVIGVLLTITICPYYTNGNTTENTELEEPVMMALSSSSKIDDSKLPYKREVWQESEGEVLIRNERGTKENGSGSTTGKKQNKKDNNNKNPNNTKNAQKQQHLNKTSDTNSKLDNIPSTTQETVKKHQQKHEKHDKMNSNSNKKHASTDKQKHKDESKQKN